MATAPHRPPRCAPSAPCRAPVEANRWAAKLEHAPNANRAEKPSAHSPPSPACPSSLKHKLPLAAPPSFEMAGNRTGPPAGRKQGWGLRPLWLSTLFFFSYTPLVHQIFRFKNPHFDILGVLQALGIEHLGVEKEPSATLLTPPARNALRK